MCRWAIAYSSSLETCADELSPITQALQTCVDELPSIAQAGGNMCSSYSSYSSFRTRWTSSCSSYSSPWANMCRWAIIYSSSFENMFRWATLLDYSSSRGNMCSSCRSRSSRVDYPRKSKLEIRQADLSKVWNFDRKNDACEFSCSFASRVCVEIGLLKQCALWI